jgi:hypothetical protein
MSDEKCGDASPICKFDGGPIYCTLPKGHDGNHAAAPRSFPEDFDWGYGRKWTQGSGLDKRVIS